METLRAINEQVTLWAVSHPATASALLSVAVTALLMWIGWRMWRLEQWSEQWHELCNEE